MGDELFPQPYQILDGILLLPVERGFLRRIVPSVD